MGLWHRQGPDPGRSPTTGRRGENDLWEEKKSRNQSGHGEVIMLMSTRAAAVPSSEGRLGGTSSRTHQKMRTLRRARVWPHFRSAWTSSSPQRPLPAWLHGRGASAETWKNRQECRQWESHRPGRGTAERRQLTTRQRRGRGWSPGRPRRTKPARSPDPDYFHHPGLHLRGRIKRLMMPVVSSSF